jgi:uncharacterized YigZ family protein
VRVPTRVTRYPVPAARHRVEQTIERSRFICTIDRVAAPEDAQRFIREIDHEFGDATHNCWAYVADAPGTDNRVGMSDDGEPHGTAGRPMLTVLLHSGVGEIAAVVTRFYGGTKLGTGGLVKAYGGAVQLALETLPRAERIDWVRVAVIIGYASVTIAQQQFARFEAETVEQQYGVDVRYLLRVPRTHLVELREALANATSGEAHMEPADNPGDGRSAESRASGHG